MTTAEHVTNMNTVSGQEPDIERLRLEPTRRSLIVTDVHLLTPKMVRVMLKGADLKDFNSPGFDDHIKIIVPDGDVEEKRDFTPRWYSNELEELVVDFVLHDHGVVTEWAAEVEVGDRLDIAGPRGSRDYSKIRYWVLIGDETALPAIGRFLEEAEPDMFVRIFAGVTGPEEQQRFACRADASIEWVHRPADQTSDPAPMLAVVQDLEIPEDTLIWIAAEAGVTKALREYFVNKGHPLSWIKASGYWQQPKKD